MHGRYCQHEGAGFPLFIYSSYFKRHVRWLSSFPQPLNYVPPGIRRATCLQPELFRVHNGANAFYSHSYF
ncbi:hypothetical protein DUB92_04245 [Salmonella enterica subsp. diarizonae]|nr:hypothetical protein [Salmonella enterica subsp. diarizonae]